jgi:mono/diheme cytochrome c family protein
VRPGLRIATLAIVVVAAGCGSSGDASRSAGVALLTEDCAMCHSLDGRPSPRQQGGDLLSVHMTPGQMLEFVREMPVPHRLGSAQQETLADYVRSIEARGF